MKPFLIAFRHDVGWDLRYLIARVTGAPVHVCCIYGDTVVDTGFDGVRLLTVKDRLEKGRWEVFTVPAQYNASRGETLGRSRVGWRYDWFGAIAAWWIGRPAGAGAKAKVFCSEEAADELLAAGVPLLYRRTAHYNPRKLRDELRNRFHWESTWVNP